MFSYNTTRAQTDFGGYVTISTSNQAGQFISWWVTDQWGNESSSIANTSSSQGCTTSISNGITVYSVVNEANGSATTNVSEIGFASSSYANGSNSSSSTWTEGVVYYASSTSTQEYDYTTTTTFETSSSIYTSSSTSTTLYSNTSTYSTSTATTATTSANCTLTSNALFSSYTYDDGNGNTLTSTSSTAATSSTSITVPYAFTTSITISSPVDVGTIISAQNDWLWSYTATPTPTDADTSGYFITAIGASFTLETFWPVVASVTATFDVLSTTNAITYINSVSTTAFTTQATWYPYDSNYNTTSYSSTVTIGNMFPRDTTTTSFTSTGIYTGSFTGGPSLDEEYYDSNTGVGQDTMLSTFVSLVASTTTSTVLYPVGFDQSTTTLSAFTYATSTYSQTVNATNSYIGYGSGSGSYTNSVEQFSSSGSSQTGISISRTNLYKVGISNVYNQTASGDVFQVVPQVGGMRTPDAMAQTDAFGANLSVSPPVYYPFTSSVQQNVIVPVPTNTTAMQYSITTTAPYEWDLAFTTTTAITSDATSWQYSWSSFSLTYTSATSESSSYTYGPSSNSSTSSYSLWQTTSSTASFAVESNMMGDYWQEGRNTVDTTMTWDGTFTTTTYGQFQYGGFAPVSSASEVAVLIGGINAVSYDTDGDTTTATTIWPVLTVSSLIDTLRVENSEQVFVTAPIAGTYDGVYLPTVYFTR